MPLQDLPLTIEPTYPKAKELMAIGREPGDDDMPEGCKIRNTFYSRRWRQTIYVWEEDGKIQWGRAGYPQQATQLLNTLMASDAWGIDQERRAVDLLATLVNHRKFKSYMLTGMFLESSKRSGVMYMFRRLRPTLALTMNHPSGKVAVLAALCMHPIAYYESSWGGAMAPTDDLIAHLMLCRGDEHMFWRRANQHPAWRPEAGI
jgi:hypothetical protein